MHRVTVRVGSALAPLALAALVLAGSGTSARVARVNVPCPATIVRHEPNARLGSLSGPWFRASPRRTRVLGFMFGGHEVNGRFALYVGAEDPMTHATQKILWIFKSGSPAAARLQITGVQLRLGPRRVRPLKKGRFRHRFSSATSDQTPGILYPSYIAAPRPGCWRLQLDSGRVHAKVVAIVEHG
jgi:hypothetical protein